MIEAQITAELLEILRHSKLANCNENKKLTAEEKTNIESQDCENANGRYDTSLNSTVQLQNVEKVVPKSCDEIIESSKTNTSYDERPKIYKLINKYPGKS